MLISDIKVNGKNKIIKTQRIKYTCDDCGKIIETPYYAYLRKKFEKDYCSSCKQTGERAPNHGKYGELNYFYGRKHTELSKKKWRKSYIGETYVVVLPNNEYPNLYGVIDFRKDNNKPLVGQKVEKKCIRCGKLETVFVNTTKSKICIKCTDNGKNLQKHLKIYLQNNPEKKFEWRAKAIKTNRKFENRKKRSILVRGIKESEWNGFIEKEKNNKEYFINRDKYKQWRLEIFERDKYTCQFPNCTFCENKRGGIILAAHHIYPKAKYPDLKFNINNGITVCDKILNKQINNREENYIDSLLEILKND